LTKSAATTPPRTVLIVLAHHDDEFFLAAAIAECLAAGGQVMIAYLTHGSLYGTQTQVRIEETGRALGRLGVDPGGVYQIGQQLDIFDGNLKSRMRDAASALSALIRKLPVDDVWVLAWEGGHHDHDCAHYLGVVAANSAVRKADVYEFSAYHAFRRPGPFFRVMQLVPRDASVSVIHLGLKQRLQMLALVPGYRSQWKTFIGLLPGIVLRVLGRGRIEYRRAAGIDYGVPPHAGRLYYEKRFGIPFAAVCAAIRTLNNE
jgi:LmbE family N-acetylglucosaminyl deacetylase